MSKRQAPTLSSLYEDDEKFGWLDNVAEPVQQTVTKLFSTPVGRKVKDVLNGTPFRHRLHPAMIILPLGGWTMAAMFDVMDRMASPGDKPAFRKAADASIAFGIVTALPTAKSGIADWVDLYDHRRRVGMAHALLNVTALTLYTSSMAIRKMSTDSRGTAQVLSGLGFGFLMMGGSVGGELVYTLGVNTPHTVYPKPPNDEMDVLASQELVEGTPVVVEAGRVPVMLLRRGSEIYAVDAWCPHAGGPLADGTFDGDVVECPWHQSRFCLQDGKPLQGPAASPLRTFEVKEQNGRILITPSYEGQSWPPPPAPATT